MSRLLGGNDIQLLVCGGQFYIMCGWFAQNPSTGGSDNPVAFFYGGTVLFFIALLVFVPILTMRLLAEERQSGIDEAMLTTPVTPLAMVMGKYLAAMTFWVAMWVPTLMYVWICKNFGYADWGATSAIFVGVMGIGLQGNIRKLGVPGEELDKVTYRLIEPEQYRGTRCAVFGGGDSAVDWAVSLAELAKKIYVVHRRDKFRAAPDMVARKVDGGWDVSGRAGWGSGGFRRKGGGSRAFVDSRAFGDRLRACAAGARGACGRRRCSSRRPRRP